VNIWQAHRYVVLPTPPLPVEKAPARHSPPSV